LTLKLDRRRRRRRIEEEEEEDIFRKYGLVE
jgi:hypothetical protein